MDFWVRLPLDDRSAGEGTASADAATAWMLKGLWTFLSSKSPRARVGRRGWFLSWSSPDLCVKAEEAPRLRLGCLGDLLFLEE